MIVDVLRNDLGRVCVPGHGPRAAPLPPRADGRRPAPRLDRHRPAGARAATRSTCSRPSFPGGSITGAPKIRAMEILETLEPVRRGPYTGRARLDRAGRRDGDVDPDPDVRRRRRAADASTSAAGSPGGATRRPSGTRPWRRRAGRWRRSAAREVAQRVTRATRPASAPRLGRRPARSPADGAAPVGVRPRLPARRRRLRDAPRPRRPADRARRAPRPAAAIGRRASAIPLPDDLEARLAAGDRGAPRRPRASAGPTATPASGSRCRAGAFFGRGLLPPDEHPAPTIVDPGLAGAAAAGRPPRARAAPRRERASGATRRTRSRRSRRRRAPTTSTPGSRPARAGADDALFLTIDGYLSEATSANIFLVRGDELGDAGRSPARSCPGTTRDWILALGGARSGLRAVEGWLDDPRPRRGRRGVPVEQRRRDPAGDPVRRRADRRPAGPARGRSAPAPTARRSSAATAPR